MCIFVAVKRNEAKFGALIVTSGEVACNTVVTMVSASCGGLYDDGESDSDADELTDVDCCQYDEIVEGETRSLSVRLQPGSARASPTLLGCFLRRTKTLAMTILCGLVVCVQYQHKNQMAVS